ncbi:hypothetical protein BGX20_006429, partial [Mortierella sp. AD010]
KAELMGLLTAVISAPPDQDIRIELDSQAVVKQFQQLVHLRSDALPRKRLWSMYTGLWAVIHNAVQERAGEVEVALGERPQKQQGQQLGGYADSYPEAPVLDGATKSKKGNPKYVMISSSARLSHMFMIGDLYTRSLAVPRTRDKRTHHVKKLHGMLPTMNIMHARHPDLYPDSVCRVCNVQQSCVDMSRDWEMKHPKTWEEALTYVDGCGRAATTSYNKERQQQYERDLRNGKPRVKKPTPVPWICPA